MERFDVVMGRQLFDNIYNYFWTNLNFKLIWNNYSNELVFESIKYLFKLYESNDSNEKILDFRVYLSFLIFLYKNFSSS